MANSWLKNDKQKGMSYPKIKATKATVYKAITWPFPPLVRETPAD